MKSRIFSDDCDVKKELNEWANSLQGQRDLKRIVENERARKTARRRLATQDPERQRKHIGK